MHTHGGVQFVNFVKFTCAYLHQIVPEIMQLLMNNLSKKTFLAHIFFHGFNYARKECLQLGHQISNIAPPLYNNSLQVNDPYSIRATWV